VVVLKIPNSFEQHVRQSSSDATSQKSGQIIATSHDLTPNGGLVKQIPLFQENPGWGNILVWPAKMVTEWFQRFWMFFLVKPPNPESLLK